MQTKLWPLQGINSKRQCKQLYYFYADVFPVLWFFFTPVGDLAVFPLPSTPCLPSDYFQSTETWTPPVV